MNPESELSTEDLASPGGVRREQQPVANTGQAQQEQLPGNAGTGDAGGRGDPPPTDGEAAQRQVGAPELGQGGDDRTGGRAAPVGTEAGDEKRPGWDDDSVQGRAGDQGATTDADALRPGEEVSSPGRSADAGSGDVALLGSADEGHFRQRWADVQARFVDNPQEAVRTADGLVAELMQSLAQGFSEHKGALEAQWRSGGDPDTEELRQALQRYRSFFDRLLST